MMLSPLLCTRTASLRRLFARALPLYAACVHAHCRCTSVFVYALSPHLRTRTASLCRFCARALPLLCTRTAAFVHAHCLCTSVFVYAHRRFCARAAAFARPSLCARRRCCARAAALHVRRCAHAPPVHVRSLSACAAAFYAVFVRAPPLCAIFVHARRFWSPR